jgi:hypothetical protein
VHAVTRRIVVALSLVAVAVLSGCNSSSNGTNNGSATLVFTNSTPSSGNATLDAPSVTYDPNADNSGFDRLTVSQTISGTTHDFYFYFDPVSGAVHSAQYVWGPSGGLAQCVSPDCVAANAVVHLGSQIVDFTNLRLADPIGTGQTTVNGDISW